MNDRFLFSFSIQGPVSRSHHNDPIVGGGGVLSAPWAEKAPNVNKNAHCVNPKKERQHGDSEKHTTG